MFETVNFQSGKVCFCSKAMDDEDILQVEYPKNYLLDLGWYGSRNGFILYIIRDREWSVPFVQYQFFKEDLAESALALAVERIEKEIANPILSEQLWKTEKILL